MRAGKHGWKAKAKTAVAMMALGVGSAHAHTGKHEARAPKINFAKLEETAFGKAADPSKANVVVVHMSDDMRFTPSRIVVNKGDIVRFKVKNRGKVMHEMVLGTKNDLAQHAVLMRKHPDMEHDEPHMVHVAPGKSGVMGWQFTRAGEFLFACLIPGHFEAGMVGTVLVRDGEGREFAGHPQGKERVLRRHEP